VVVVMMMMTMTLAIMPWMCFIMNMLCNLILGRGRAPRISSCTWASSFILPSYLRPLDITWPFLTQLFAEKSKNMLGKNLLSLG